MTNLHSEPLEIGKTVEYVNSPLRFVQMESEDRIIINGDQPTHLVMRLGPVLSLVPLYKDYPRCIQCDYLVVTGRELLQKLLSGEIGGVCNVCDPADWPGFRTHYYENRYERTLTDIR